ASRISAAAANRSRAASPLLSFALEVPRLWVLPMPRASSPNKLDPRPTPTAPAAIPFFKNERRSDAVISSHAVFDMIISTPLSRLLLLLGRNKRALTVRLMTGFVGCQRRWWELSRPCL